MMNVENGGGKGLESGRVGGKVGWVGKLNVVG
jgi:hypothetical protein